MSEKRLYLKAEFTRRGLEIGEVARRAGCSRGHLSRVIHGRVGLDDKLARDIALATGIPKAIVLGLEIPQQWAQGDAGVGPTGKGDSQAATPATVCSGA